MAENKKVYLYDESKNNLLIGEYFTQKDELESEIQEKEIFFEPVSSTELEPLDQSEGKTVNFIEGAWTYVDIPEEEIEVPEEVDPRELMIVTAAQAHAAIATKSPALYDQIESMMNDPETEIKDKIFWNKAQVFKRLSPTVVRIGSEIGLSEEDLDELFALAATIDA